MPDWILKEDDTVWEYGMVSQNNKAPFTIHCKFYKTKVLLFTLAQVLLNVNWQTEP